MSVFKDLELQSGFWLHSFLIDHIEKNGRKKMLEETPENSNLSEVFITHFFVFRMSSTFFIWLE